MSVDLVFRYEPIRFFATSGSISDVANLRYQQELIVFDGVNIPSLVNIRVDGRLSLQVNSTPTQLLPSGKSWNFPETGQLFPRAKIRRP